MKETEVFTSFLGTGWGFPPTFSDASGDVAMISEVNDILESLGILLSTSIGERIMQPSYGCNLRDFLFEPIDVPTMAYMRSLITDAILYHEPRIRLNKVNFNTDEYLEGKLLIEIDFVVSSTNSRYNFVYPFYINEANSLEK
jgi:hypothetical protein